MKIALLSGASSIHTIRWANGLAESGYEIHLITQHKPCDPLSDRVILHKLPFRGAVGYFIMVPTVKKIVNQIKPDIINAHYASGYATTARLVASRPWLLSVWGSDIYDFPKKSFLHKWLVRTNLYAADAVASTSLCMAAETRRLAPRLNEIPITPFGVDIHAYENIEPVSSRDPTKIVVGTVKNLAYKYGVDTLIDAFALLLKKVQKTNIEIANKLLLRIVGDGPSTEEYQQQAKRLEISDKIIFVGRVPHAKVPTELAKIDIFVSLSRLDSESFGVAIIEAGAAGRPVVVSDAGGLPEVTLHNKTGLVVPREHPQAAANAIEKLVLSPELRRKFGLAGRSHVEAVYNWNACIDKMISTYESVIADEGKV